MIDSTRKLTGAGATGTQRASVGGDATGGMAEAGAMVMVLRSRVGGGDGGAAPPMRGGAATVPSLPPFSFVPPYELPDYRPAFSTGASKADTQGNLWIRTSEAKDGRPVYDVVNEQGKLIDRVQLPPFRTIAGFGPGVVYMGVVDATGSVHLERARIK